MFCILVEVVIRVFKGVIVNYIYLILLLILYRVFVFCKIKVNFIGVNKKWVSWDEGVV